jgi:hypothetical protein
MQVIFTVSPTFKAVIVSQINDEAPHCYTQSKVFLSGLFCRVTKMGRFVPYHKLLNATILLASNLPKS